MRRRAVLLLTVMTVALVMAASPAWAETFTVNSTGDGADAAPSGVCNTAPFQAGTEPECTLRAAIEEANATTAADTIDFNIGGGSGVKSIRPASSLPTITQPVTINGYSEPGARVNTKAVGNNAVLKIELDGSAGGAHTGLHIEASDVTVKGLVINRFTLRPIHINGGTGNRIEGNFIGTDPSGTKDRSTGVQGVLIHQVSSVPVADNVVGGDTPASRNLISGAGGYGVVVFEGSSRIQGNYIGTTKDGTDGNIGNGGGLAIFSSGNHVGGDSVAARNLIAFNGTDGVSVSPGRYNGILSNSIYSNGALGIDLADDGVTPNDGPGDADTGANNLQNYPVLSSAKTGQRATTIKGTLKSTQGPAFTIQFFSNPRTSRDEGKNFIGEKSVTDTDGDGIISFTFKPRKKVEAGMFVTATATNAFTDDTSEFSGPKMVRG